MRESVYVCVCLYVIYSVILVDFAQRNDDGKHYHLLHLLKEISKDLRLNSQKIGNMVFLTDHSSHDLFFKMRNSVFLPGLFILSWP